jgi:acyl carrier protein
MGTELRNIVFDEMHKRMKASVTEQISEAADLASLGIDSMDIITILTNLERRVGLDFDRMVGLTPPKTVQDLLKMVEDACG